MSSEIYDIAIIGGGINGCGIARDAAGRGLKVYLCDKGDIGEGTSSRSTKLIHGGLRYLENFECALVRHSLIERKKMQEIAPHLVMPMRFVLPHHDELRPAWFIRLGLLAYDYLGPRGTLKRSHGVLFPGTIEGQDLKKKFWRGFEYSDCWVDDARLVLHNALDAAKKGATIQPHNPCKSAKVKDGLWQVKTKQGIIQAKCLINAAGPWASEILDGVITSDMPGALKLVQGTHIVVPNFLESKKSYLIQHDDGRIVFAIPYQKDFCLIGTTEVEVNSATDAAPTETEIKYLCRVISATFRKKITPDDVVYSYAGVRALYKSEAENLSQISREYRLEYTDEPAPMLTVFGGKLTTYRELSEKALDQLRAAFPNMKDAWTSTPPLPGGDFDGGIDKLMSSWPFLDKQTARRIGHAYGTRAAEFLGKSTKMEDLGEDFGHGFTRKELGYLVSHEWAQTIDDVLWRRTKLGLHLDKKQQAAVKKALKEIVGK